MLAPRRLFFPLVILLFFQLAFAQTPSSTQAWLEQTRSFYLGKIDANVSPTRDAKGAIIAATSNNNPNYYFHWVRDAGLVADTLVAAYSSPSFSAEEKTLIAEKLNQYIDFSTRIQATKTLSDLGEPKFNVNGTPFNDAWARPQNDGPAVRALSLIHWARVLLDEGKEDIVRSRLYGAEWPAKSPIKIDLEYISHAWQKPSYDIWEEVKGTHFYTLMVTRRALREGAALAIQLQDPQAAEWYNSQAQAIEAQLARFWDEKRGYIVATLDRTDGIDYKSSNLDTSVILGLLYGDMHDGFFSWNDPRVQATLQQLVKSFKALYPINQQPQIPGIAIGRYPEDRYAGSNFSGGNPWVLCTLAMAEAIYRSANLAMQQHELTKANLLRAQADQFVERVRYHADRNGSLSEQINRETGFMTSAENLTWNYAMVLDTGFITAT